MHLYFDPVLAYDMGVIPRSYPMCLEGTTLKGVMTMIRPLSMREPLPDRRRSWTQEVVIGGQDFCLTVGEYKDGRPGEVWIEANKEGTFTRGVLSILSRSISISLQCGADLEAICHSLNGIDYPPDGEVFPVNGCTTQVKECYSVTNWVSQELEFAYIIGKDTPKVEVSATAQGDPIPEKVAGYISEPWRSGA